MLTSLFPHYSSTVSSGGKIWIWRITAMTVTNWIDIREDASIKALFFAFSPKHLTVCHHTTVTITNNSRHECLHHYFIYSVINAILQIFSHWCQIWVTYKDECQQLKQKDQIWGKVRIGSLSAAVWHSVCVLTVFWLFWLWNKACHFASL